MSRFRGATAHGRLLSMALLGAGSARCDACTFPGMFPELREVSNSGGLEPEWRIKPALGAEPDAPPTCPREPLERGESGE